MKSRYRLIRRGVRSGAFYCVDTKTGKRTSLQTGNQDEARQVVEAKNQAERQPFINLQIARAYAWAERAKVAGYPERFAQEALGHGSKAVHRAYARKAQVLLPSLEEYEKRAKAGNLITVIQPEPAVSAS